MPLESPAKADCAICEQLRRFNVWMEVIVLHMFECVDKPAVAKVQMLLRKLHSPSI